MTKQIFKLALVAITFFIISSCSSDDDNICVPDTSIDFASSEVTEIDTNHHRIYTDIVVNVSASELWAVLTDFGNMPNWSSSFQGLSGNISNGGEVTVTYILPNPVTGDPTQSQFTRTLMYSEGVQYGWSAESNTFPGITDNHIFRVEAISECQSRFIHTDEFQGTNANFTTEDLANGALSIYNQFNSELKIEAEQ